MSRLLATMLWRRILLRGVEARFEYVRFQTNERLVGLPLPLAKALELRLADAGAGRIVEAFRLVGTSRPIVLDNAEKPVLLSVVEDFLATHGTLGATAGVAELKEALQADLRA